MISRIIHQIWDTHEVPAEYERWRDSFREHNPTWSLRLWTHEESRALVAEHFGDFLDTYDSFPFPIMRVDAVRPCLLHHYGGVYADLDVECLQSLDRLVSADLPDEAIAIAPKQRAGLILGLERRLMSGDVCMNAMFASRAGHPFWLEVLEEMQRRFQPRKPLAQSHASFVLNGTGPELTDAVCRRLAHSLDDLLLVHPEVLSPRGWWDYGPLPQRSLPFTVHHHRGSWVSDRLRLWQRLLRAFPRPWTPRQDSNRP